MITYGLGRDSNVVGSYVAFGLGINTLAAQIIVDVAITVTIAEELRILKVSEDTRVDVPEIEVRACTIKQHNRIMVIED